MIRLKMTHFLFMSLPFAAAWLRFASAATEVQRYSYQEYLPSEWPAMVFKVVRTKSVLECGSECQDEAGKCETFAMREDECYLAQTNKTDGSLVTADQGQTLQFFTQEGSLVGLKLNLYLFSP